jgi:hypothetical protein
MRPILTLRQYTHDLIVHSHEHAQLVFGLSGALDFEVEGCGSQVRQQSFVVIPSGAHHACGSPDGSRCLVMDIPDGQWLVDSLGDHADASRRLLDQPARLSLDSGQSQLVSWLANSPVSDPLIAQQGSVLLLASLNQARPAETGGPTPALCGAGCAHRAKRRISAASRRSGKRIAGLSKRAPACTLHGRVRADADGLHPQPTPASGRANAPRHAVAHGRSCQSRRLQLAECLLGRRAARVRRITRPASARGSCDKRR